MPSDVPKEGRCGAKVTSKVGLEIHDTVLDEVFVDDGRSDDDNPTESDVADPEDEYDREMVGVVVSDDEHEQEVDPTWEDVLPLLREDWYVESVVIEHETDDAIEYERVSIEDEDPYVTNRTSKVDGFCLRYPDQDADHGRCYHHVGPYEKGHTVNMKHGFYVTRSKFYEWLGEEDREKDQQFIHMMVDSWLEDAPFDRSNTAKVNELFRAAVDQLRLWYSIDEFVEKSDGPYNDSGEYSGLAYTRIVGTNDDGDEIEVFDENPINLPYSRLHRDVQSTLKNMGIYDSPEKEQAEATKSLAQALSGE